MAGKRADPAGGKMSSRLKSYKKATVHSVFTVWTAAFCLRRHLHGGGSLLLIQIAPQGGAADAKLLGGGGLVAAAVRHGLGHGVPGELLQGPPGQQGGDRLPGPGVVQGLLAGEQVGDRAAPDVGGVGEDGQLAQHLLELGVVVGPVVAPQQLDGLGVEADDLLAQVQVQAVQVEAGQR